MLLANKGALNKLPSFMGLWIAFLKIKHQQTDHGRGAQGVKIRLMVFKQIKLFYYFNVLLIVSRVSKAFSYRISII